MRDGDKQTAPRPAISGKGMVSTNSRMATEVGARVLGLGGNAVDAIVAVAFSAAVVFPTAGNIGGGGFAIYRDRDGEAWALDFRETAPLAAVPDMFLDPVTGKPTEASLVGATAAAVPGAGLWALHKRLGPYP